MKIWKIVTVLLAVLLLAGCVGSVSGAPVSTITITGIEAPDIDDEPDTSASANSGVTVNKVTWSPDHDTFDAGTSYTVKVTVKATEGFADGVTAKVNSQSATVDSISEDKKTAVVSYKFSATAAADIIDEIEILDITAPVTAAKPDTSVTVDTNEGKNAAYADSITWDPSASTYLMDKAYKVTIKLKLKSNAYEWASSVSAIDAKIGGYTLDDDEISKSGDTVTLTYTYPKTKELGRISSMNLAVTAPAVGKSPSSAVTTNSNMFTASASWSPSGTFLPDTSYTTTITINAKYGYLFDTGTVTAKVNGADAYVQKISDTKATVSYTFAQIASVNSVDVTFDAPATGDTAPTKATYVTTSPTGSANAATISWSPSLVEGAYEAGVEYTAAVTIPIISSSNTAFDKDTIVYINGEKAEVDSVSANSLKVTYTFPKTLFIPNPIEIIKEMFNLMLAIFNPASYVFL